MNIEQLEKLNDLKEKGIITNEEFEAQKKLLLEDNSADDFADDTLEDEEI